MFSPITQKRWQKFKNSKRAYYALIILLVAYFLSFFAEFIANDKPLLVKYGRRFYFPVLKFYSVKNFGEKYDGIPDYKELRKSGRFARGTGNYMIFPLIPYGSNESLLDLQGYPPTPPTRRNWLGTDDRGRDILTRLIYGFRISFTFALILTCAGTILGIAIGAMQGFYGGILDLSVQRLIEILSALPFLYVAVMVGNILGTNFVLLLMLFLIFDWIGISYYMRSEYLKMREMQFVEASRAMGVGNWKIMFRHILPNTLTPIITFTPFMMAGAIFSLSALDYLGFGFPAPTPSWGELMNQGLSNLSSYWLSIFPFLAMFGVLLLIVFVGEGFREAFDPKEYYRME